MSLWSKKESSLVTLKLLIELLVFASVMSRTSLKPGKISESFTSFVVLLIAVTDLGSTEYCDSSSNQLMLD